MILYTKWNAYTGIYHWLVASSHYNIDCFPIGSDFKALKSHPNYKTICLVGRSTVVVERCSLYPNYFFHCIYIKKIIMPKFLLHQHFDDSYIKNGISNNKVQFIMAV